MEHRRPAGPEGFEIAIICALPIESDAIIALFDEFWEDEEQYQTAEYDTNSYTIGRVAQHNVVLVHMPTMGKVSAAAVAANLRASFPCIRLGVLVGICGGVPYGQASSTHQHELFLGDVVISTQVIQTDFGRTFPEEFIRKDTLEDNLGRPNPHMRGFLVKMQGMAARTELKNTMIAELGSILAEPEFSNWRFPGFDQDELYDARYPHKHSDNSTCSACAVTSHSDAVFCSEAARCDCEQLGCRKDRLISRARDPLLIQLGGIPTPVPQVHFGSIGSGDQVMKSAMHRDTIAEREDIIAFEMESAGLWDTIPTVVIKGVCDYADSHKNKKWQLYAAATAAACSKSFLKKWRPKGKPVQRIGDSDGRPSSSALPRQVFSGNFTAGKSIHQGGTYNSGGPIFF